MQKFIIQGQKPLGGEIAVRGAKNEVLKLLPAAVLIPGPVTLTNVPWIAGVDVMSELITELGGKVEQDRDKHQLVVDASGITKTEMPDELVTKERATSVFASSMLARFGEVTLHHPGGDVIGQRPLDLLLDGLETLGAKVVQGDREYRISASKLKGARFIFKRVSWTVTDALILAATLAEGTTELINAAMEPEVVALIEFLNAHGAKITGAGSPVIKIQGVDSLRAIDQPTRVIPDRLEAATFVCAAAATNGNVVIKDCVPGHMEVFLKYMSEIGVPIERGVDSLTVKQHKELKAVELITHEYPGFSTDYQSTTTVLLTQAKGLSLVHETIFEGRLFYTDKLKQMGADITMADPHRVLINGPSQLRGRKIVSPDLRAGMALVIAGLIAEGETTIGNIYQITRGYEDIDERLRSLGADIKMVETDYF